MTEVEVGWGPWEVRTGNGQCHVLLLRGNL